MTFPCRNVALVGRYRLKVAVVDKKIAVLPSNLALIVVTSACHLC